MKITGVATSSTTAHTTFLYPVTLDVKNDGSIPKEAYEVFKYCSLKKPDLKKDDDSVAVLRINPRNANNIFVADQASRIKYKKQCFEGNSEKYMLTYEEYDESQRRTGRTIVPIHQYKGNYEQPVVLVGRELSFDEVEIVDVKKITVK